MSASADRPSPGSPQPLHRSPQPARVLVVEDDPQLGPLLVEVLADDYAVELARDGQVGLHLAMTRPFEAMVVDRGLPGIEGVDLVGRLRRSGVTTPALVLTARGTVRDRVEGLDAGAEDYMVKPFDVDELLARIRALLRRHPDGGDVVQVGTRQLDVPGRRLTGAGRPAVDLTDRECRLLEVLARRPRQVFTRPELLALVFDPSDTPNTVDTYVHYLRRKSGRDVVATVHGIGYRLGAQ